MKYVGRTKTDSHKRPCRAYEEKGYYYVLATATVPGQGFFYEFKKKHVRRVIHGLPKTKPFLIEDVSPHMKAVEKNRVKNRALEMRSDYLIQLLKILGQARYNGKDGKKLLYVIV